MHLAVFSSSSAPHFVTEYSPGPFPLPLPKLLPLRSPVTSWLANVAAHKLNFLVLFHGTPDCVDGDGQPLFFQYVLSVPSWLQALVSLRFGVLQVLVLAPGGLCTSHAPVALPPLGVHELL